MSTNTTVSTYMKYPRRKMILLLNPSLNHLNSLQPEAIRPVNLNVLCTLHFGMLKPAY